MPPDPSSEGGQGDQLCDGSGDPSGKGAVTRRIRAAAPADRPPLRALQTHLPSPWPELLGLATTRFPSDGGPFALIVETVRTDRSPTIRPPHVCEPVGYLLAAPGTPVEAHGSGDHAGGVYVAELVVKPGWRRDGHGSALLDALETRVSCRERLRLTARADDERAIAFYRTNGFRVVDVVPEHYDDGDGLVLARRIDPR